MDDYNFWADLLDTFQSSSDAIKALCLVIPPAFTLALTRLVLRHRLAVRQVEERRNRADGVAFDGQERRTAVPHGSGKMLDLVSRSPSLPRE